MPKWYCALRWLRLEVLEEQPLERQWTPSPQMSKTGPTRDIRVGFDVCLSHVRLFGNFQCIVYVDTQVSHRAFKSAMAEEQLDGP